MGESMQCSHADIFKHGYTQDFLCHSVALEVCKESQEILNFFELYWCDIGGNVWLMLLIALFCVFLIFKYTSLTVEEYIAEGIQNLVEWLNMSEALAAVTLLALANGAGDVITAIVASGADGGVSYNIGSLYGAGLFVASMVVAICVLQSKETMVFDKMVIYRDVGFYIVSGFITISFALYKSITWWMACILLGWYAVLVLFVVYSDKKKPKEGNTKSIEAPAEKETNEDEQQDQERGYTQKEKEEVAGVLGPLMLEIGNANFNQPGQDIFAGIAHVMRIHQLADQLKLKMGFLRTQRSKELAERSWFEIVMHILEKPFSVALFLTVMPCSKDQYSKFRCMVFPIPGLLFAVWVVAKSFSWLSFLSAVGVGAALSLFFYLTLNKESPPKYFILFNLIGVIGGLMWTYVLVGVLIDLLTCIGVILNLDNTYLGLTILAVGNALPDALTTIALCKQGAGTLALSGAYAGQLFGLLVGFGLSMLKQSLKDGNSQLGEAGTPKVVDLEDQPCGDIEEQALLELCKKCPASTQIKPPIKLSPEEKAAMQLPNVRCWGPYSVRGLENGKKYNFCTCGLSRLDPFCDNQSHKGTKFKPLTFEWNKQTTM